MITYLKSVITNPDIIVGDFTYYDGDDFEQHVTHHYNFIGDKLIIGKFCQIAKGIEFIMNGANHQMNAVSTFPFFIFDDWRWSPPPKDVMPYKGNTIIGNDVWIGQNVTILPGVHIYDGAIIGCNSVVSHDVDAYTIVAGNPIRIIRKRFNTELINLLLKFKWWDKSTDEIKKILPILTNPNLNVVKHYIKKALANN